MDSKIIDLSIKLAEKNMKAMMSMPAGTKDYSELMEKTTGLLTWATTLEHDQSETAIKLKNIEIEIAKNESYVLTENKKLETQKAIEANKIAAQKELDTAKIEAQKELDDNRAKSNEKVEKQRSTGNIIVGALGLVTTVGSIVVAVINATSSAKVAKMQIESTNQRFEMATKKEFDEPITTLTNKTVVQNGLRNF